MFEIDKNVPIPIYYQLKQMIKKKIEKGEFKPGDRLPTEHKLCDMFGISRTPVRQALTELTREGILYRKPALGTFVSDFSLSPSQDVMRIKVLIPEEKWSTTLEKAVRLYNEEHADRQIRLNLLLIGYPELRFKIRIAVASGSAPDFSLIDSVWVTQLAKSGFLRPLDEIDSEWVEREYKQDFFPVFVEGSCCDGHVYAIHVQTDVALIWYRKDWFQAEGMRPPSTWDELIEVAKHFQRTEVRKRYGLGSHSLAFPAGLKAGETTTYLLLPFLWSTGGDVFADGKVALDSNATRRAIGFIRDLVHQHHVAPPEVTTYEWNRSPKLFARGEVTMSIGGSYESALIKEVANWDDDQFQTKVGFVPIPAGPGGEQTTTAGGMSYAIYRQAEDPELALEILKIATGPRLMKELCLATGQNPPRISVYKALDPERDWFLYQTSKMLYRARVRPLTPEYARVSEQLRAMIENAISGQMSVDKAVGRAAEIISAITGLTQG
ncbi:MAG TPA: extracellular solute-binding protein [Thermoplasmata archaeon]|nr:extracellular solute-binding protein [Thermoplasmata archaeon]